MADEPDLIAMTIEVVANYVAHNTIAPDDLPGFIAKTHTAIKGLNEPAPEVPSAPAAPEFMPAVSVRKSLASREHILSLIDGKPYKTLKRHLSGHGLTPADYRARYGLKADYPMVAPAYSDHRREVARTLGLGRKVTGIRTASAGESAPAVEAPAAATPAPPATARKAPAVKAAAKRATPAPVVEAPATEAQDAEAPAPASSSGGQTHTQPGGRHILYKKDHPPRCRRGADDRGTCRRVRSSCAACLAKACAQESRAQDGKAAKDGA